jgi:hypothetical protein
LTAAIDFVGACGPNEGLGVMVCLGDEAVDGGLEIDDRAKDATLEASLGKFGEEGLDSIEPRAHEVGLKWKTKRGCRPSHCQTFGCLCVA